MRIISGLHKGRRITAPRQLPIRPTTDMAKEGLFNIINNRLHFKNLKVLDLFSGSGNISYEFCSRGAGPVIAVDENIECVKFIKKTALELEMDITLVKSDVFKYLEKAAVKANVVFADPPYDFEEGQFLKIVDLVMEKEILGAKGILIVEHSKHSKLESSEFFKESRKYGNSVFSFFYPKVNSTN